MVKEIICIICPRGCRIKVEGEGKGIVKIDNNLCKRGYEYSKSEFINPCRILTSSVKLLSSHGRRMMPVRSTKPIPKEFILDCMKVIKKISIEAPVKINQVIISDILGTGIDIISCMSINKEN
jgi:CxxC motif-containing protein